MITSVLDTHTALWYLFNDPRLSDTAKAHIEEAAARGDKVALSSISLAEVLYLSEKGRIAQEAFDELVSAIDNPAKVFHEIPLDSLIVRRMRFITRDQVPDLPDRVIAATGLHLGVAVISRDARIRASGLQTIW